MGVPIGLFFQNFSKILIFGHFLAVFGSKLTPKWSFSLSQCAFSSGRVQDGFQTQNGFTRSTFRGMPSFVPKFAFQCPKLDLETPQFEEFSEIGTLHKVCAHFFLTSFSTYFRLKMGLLGVPLGACRVWCRNSQFQWSILELEKTPI